MAHDTPLITTIIIALSLAFIMGLAAHRFKLPTIAGYLVAGVLIGPFTPGYVADVGLAGQLAELGVILLMFGVGLHFSVEDLLKVKNIAVPGALGQITVATLCGMAAGWAFGWSIGAGFLFGLSLSVASTVVLLRAMQEHDLMDSNRGRIAVGWLVVEDLAMVLALVLIPALSGLLGGTEQVAEGGEAAEVARSLAGPIAGALIWTVVKVAAFVAIMLIVGGRVIPTILHHTAHTGSRELFRLGVLTIALGTAFGSAEMFGVSLALGAFFAGMVMARSTLASRAAMETLPLRDAFAVLFFVSVGMLFDPTVILRDPIGVIVTVSVILIVKSVAAFGIVKLFGLSNDVALTIAASLAQIGEFSFILISMGVAFKIVPADAQDLVVAGALVSILVNPFIFTLAGRRIIPVAKAQAMAEAKVKAE
ncbi:MAG: cation:proton antiporter [Deltaproteobacteria bacterium]